MVDHSNMETTRTRWHHTGTGRQRRGKLDGRSKFFINIMHPLTKAGFCLFLGLGIAACGVKGPLVLPDKKPAAARKATTKHSAPAGTDAEKKPETEQKKDSTQNPC
jgi:predicted small lipoprotein YifL